ncbi:hypothetical protein FD755_006714 [Muntiacus reevesi]|uniref:EF-hand domain-containing protein n=1 Tax=Muntiacus reevesi TaxID=9886 RepID=A0A5J5MYB0_MUNRE|nr:hypothetical protein FD755_006714 [Muntiacus reevesi]
MLLRIKGDKARKWLAPNPILSVYPNHDSRNSFLWAGHHARGFSGTSQWIPLAGHSYPIPDEETLWRGRGSCFRSCHRANTGCFCDEPGLAQAPTAEWGVGRPETSLAQDHWLSHLHPLPTGKPHTPAAKMSSKRAKAKTTKKRPQRATSNVFAMFDQSQIQEFKEAFNMIDQNRDGFIDKEDLHDMLASMGKNPTDEYLEGMMSEAPGPINFTMFLTMFGEKLNGTDPEDVIRNAFACFDEEASGFIHEDHLRELLTTMGDRFTDEEVDEMYREAPIDKKGNFNYVEFTRILKHGAKDKDD